MLSRSTKTFTLALQGWREFASLAYPAALMYCAEGWCYTGVAPFGYLASAAHCPAPLHACTTAHNSLLYIA